MSKTADQLREAIDHSETNLAGVAKAAGVSRSILTRTVSGAEPRLDTCERIADALGYELKLTPKRKAKRGR